MGCVQIHSDRRYSFPVGVDVVWDAFDSVDRYRSWWPWLRRFDATGLEVGDRWTCTITPPVPYVLRFVVELTDVTPCERVTATVSGDITGLAELGIAETGDGCDVTLHSTLAPHGGPLRAVTSVAPWLARYGHDWVLDTGVRQFRRRAFVTAMD